MKLYRNRYPNRITYYHPSMKYKIEKPDGGQYWELKEARCNKYVTIRYFKYFSNAKKYLADNI